MYRPIAILLVVCLVLLSGCPAGEQSGGIIDFSGNLSATDDGFVMDGQITNEGPGEAPTYTNVSVYLFRENGTLIESADIDQLVRRTNISMRSNHIPKYVVINSPEFWEYGEIDVSYYTYRDGIYGEKTIGSKDEFPVRVPG